MILFLENDVPELVVVSGLNVTGTDVYLYINQGEENIFRIVGRDDSEGPLTYRFVEETSGALIGSPDSERHVNVTVKLTDGSPVNLG